MTLQSIRTCQQVFSAALIAHVEATYADDAVKNDLCVPIPHPDTDVDFVRVSVANARNERRWAEEPGLGDWLAKSRLNWFGRLGPAPPADPAAAAEAARRGAEAGLAIGAKLAALLPA
jgi:hypothetical protein